MHPWYAPRKMPNAALAAIMVGICLSCSAGCADVQAPAIANRGTDWIISNGIASRAVSVRENRLQTTSITDERTGAALNNASTIEFHLTLQDGTNLPSTAFKVHTIQPATGRQTRRLSVILRHPSGLDVTVLYEATPDRPVLRKRLQITGDGQVLRRVEVERLALRGAEPWHGGFGLPVFTDRAWLGLQFPAGHNLIQDDGTITLLHHPGQRLSDQPYATKWACVGLAGKQTARRAFDSYLRSLRVAGPSLIPHINFNTWYSTHPLGSPTQQNCLELIQKLADHDVPIDTFTIDAGWSNPQSFYGIHNDRFPQSFAPLRRKLHQMGARLGLWVSPSSVYGNQDKQWLRDRGYEVAEDGRGTCFYGPKYHRDFTARLSELARTLDIRHFKLDGIIQNLKPDGTYAHSDPVVRERTIQAFCDTCRAIKRAEPEVFLEPTCFGNHSPWWALYTDTVLGGFGDDYPMPIAPHPQYKLGYTAARDAAYRAALRRELTPTWVQESFGIMVLDKWPWLDDAVMVLGRGSLFLPLYIDPEDFTDSDWQSLADLMHWFRDHAPELTHPHLIGGDPAAGRPYGYLHTGDDLATAFLSNPSLRPQPIELQLPKSNPGAWQLWQLYPDRRPLGNAAGGSGATLRLPPGAMWVVAAEPTSATGAEPEKTKGAKTSRIQIRLQKTSAPLRPDLPNAELHEATAPIDIPLTPTHVSLACFYEPDAAHGRAFLDRCRLKLSSGERELPARHHLPFRQVSYGGSAPAGWTWWTAALPQDPPQPLIAHLFLQPPLPAVTTGTFAALIGDTRKPTVQPLPNALQHLALPLPDTFTTYRLLDAVPDIPLRCTPEADFAGGLTPEQQLDRFEVLLTGDPEDVDIRSARPDTDTLRLQFSPPGPHAALLLFRPQQGPWFARYNPAAYDTWDASLAQRSQWPLQRMPWVSATTGWGEIHINRSCMDKPLRVADTAYERGIGAHAHSRISYFLGGSFVRFTGLVGKDEEVAGGTIVFRIFGDGELLWNSPVMTTPDSAIPFEVDVKGIHLLTLQVTDAGDGIAADHADWIQPMLSTTDPSPNATPHH